MLQTEQTLTDQTVTRLEEKLQAKFSGRDNWHRPLVLEQGLKASPWTLTPAEMDFLNSSRMTRDEILAVFRVPPPITGIVENMGLGADIWFGARVMFCEGTIQPKLDLIGQALTRDLGRRYGPDVAVELPGLFAAEPGPTPQGRRTGREARPADFQRDPQEPRPATRSRTRASIKPILPKALDRVGRASARR